MIPVTDKIRMNRKRLSAVQLAFEDMAALLEASEAAARVGKASLPVPALPSLLERSEEISSRTSSPSGNIMLLNVFPGLAPLDPGFWHARLPGVTTVWIGSGISASTGTAFASLAVSAAMTALEAMGRDAAREGRRVMALNHAGTMPDPTPPGDADSRILVAHPLVAFHLGNGWIGDRLHTLETFSRAMLDWLDARDDTAILRVEDLAKNDISALAEQLGYGALRGRSVPVLGPIPWSACNAPSDIEHYPAYVALCDRLGYDSSGPDTGGVQAPPHRRNQRQKRAHAVGGKVSFMSTVRSLSDRTGAPHPDLAAMAKRAVETATREGRNFFTTFDRQTESLPRDAAALARLIAASHFSTTNKRIMTIGLINEALDASLPQERWIRWLAASIFFDLGMRNEGVLALADDMPEAGIWPQSVLDQLNTAILPYRGAKKEHGHSLLIADLSERILPPSDRRRLMIEIGTTREQIPSQGSTEKLARLCKSLDMDFITVDMDPRNSTAARNLFHRNGLDARAVTEKGEDFLARHPGPFDFVFLDAYDFDHGSHTEERQSRYETFLGSRIDEEQCHRMHLDCARSLVGKLAEHGLICFDDTWRDESGNWTAKGTTAMPFLLENGFEVIEVRNRATLLRRKP